MRFLRSSRRLLLALMLSIVPASSYAGVFISVGFAPPVLPVYVQPPCPQPGLMWTPGYWAYGDDGYYWVPGAWVPAPYLGALWTPPYWGWTNGMYMFHPGYWGPHVGYYGGVNYGFGYMGVGFVGGMWRDHDFVYNTAVMRVNTTVIHNTYIDRTIVERNTIVNDRHVAYSGGPGGIQHQPSSEERLAMRDQHLAPTSFQRQQERSARMQGTSYFNNNHGRPNNLVASRPLSAESHPGPMNLRPGTFSNRGMGGANNGMQNGQGQPKTAYQNRGYGQQGGNFQNRPSGQYQRPNNQGYNQQQQRQFQSRQNQGGQAQNRQYDNRQVQQNRPQPQYQQRNDQRYRQRPVDRPQDRPDQNPHRGR